MNRTIVLILTCLCASPALASDHFNLEEGLPTELEDAYPVGYRGREIQSAVRYDRTRADENQLLLEPRLEFGVAPNTQVTLRVPFYVGNGDRTGSGNIGLGALYNFNTEGLVLPALAIAGEGEIPTGKDSRGFDTALKLILTKSVSQSGLDRVHLNVAWHHNAGNDELEREHRYEAVVGYSRRINADWALVANFVREQEHHRGENSNVVELGTRWQVTPLSVLSFGAGAGIGEESPVARVTIGLQKSF